MVNYIVIGEEHAKKANKCLQGSSFLSWIFGNKYEKAAEHFETATNAYKLAKEWEKAARLYDELAVCYSKTDSAHEEATAKREAGDCYKKVSSHGAAIDRYKDAAKYLDMKGSWSSAAQCYNNVANSYLSYPQPDIKSVMQYFDLAAQRYETGNLTSSANTCRLKIAKLAAEAADYDEAVRIYEKIAQESLGNNLLKFGARKHLLFAGLCRFCKGESGDFVENYIDMDPSFSNSREYRLLANIVKALQGPTEENLNSALSLYSEIESTISDDTSSKTDEMSSRKHLMSTLFPRVEEMLESGGAQGQDDEQDLT